MKVSESKMDANVIQLFQPLKWCFNVKWSTTLLEKSCDTPTWDNKIDMDRIFVFPVGWNWHEMCLSLLPSEILPYLGQTFTSMPSGIVEVQHRSLTGHFPKSAFVLW